MRDYACAILVRNGTILLGRRAAHRRAYPLCWDVIGGRVEDGETLDDALRRELGEELGIVPDAYEPLGRVVDNSPLERGEATYHMHIVRAWTGGEPAMVDDEHIELAWFTVEDACALPELALAEYVEMFRLVT